MNSSTEILGAVLQTLEEVIQRIDDEVEEATYQGDLTDLVDALLNRNEGLKQHMAANLEVARHKFSSDLVAEYAEMAVERQEVLKSLVAVRELASMAGINAIMQFVASKMGEPPAEQTTEEEPSKEVTVPGAFGGDSD